MNSVFKLEGKSMFNSMQVTSRERKNYYYKNFNILFQLFYKVNEFHVFNDTKSYYMLKVDLTYLVIN